MSVPAMKRMACCRHWKHCFPAKRAHAPLCKPRIAPGWFSALLFQFHNDHDPAVLFGLAPHPAPLTVHYPRSIPQPGGNLPLMAIVELTFRHPYTILLTESPSSESVVSVARFVLARLTMEVFLSLASIQHVCYTVCGTQAVQL